MRNKFLLFVFALALIGWQSKAQQSATVIPPSPDAAALGKYGNIPVSTYTGVPNIEIPLYSVDYRDVHIPVNLSYHSSGNTVEQDASWVGLGWTLDIGGVITRTVRGGDDMQFSDDGFSNLNGGQTFYQGYPYDPPTSPDSLSGETIDDICNKYVDAEPDIFYFNFLGESGRFVLEQGQDRNLSYVTGRPLEVKKISIRYEKNNHQWLIKTADGFAYYFKTLELTEVNHAKGGGFGKGPDDITFDPITQGFLTYDDIVVSAWYLDKIVSPLGEEVNYVYDVVSSGYGIRSPYGSSKLSLNDVKATVFDVQFYQTSGCLGGDLDASDYYSQPASKMFINHIYLKEIQYSLGKIVLKKSLRDDMALPAVYGTGYREYLTHAPFYMSWMNSGPQKLDTLKIFDKSGGLIKKIEFSYGYFNENKTGIEGYQFRRLKLDKVRECGASACKPFYELSYDETHPLPSKYSTSQDFWGYYNGANNPSRIPHGTYVDMTQNKIYYLGDANRQPNPVYMTSSILKKIVYPTGGTTTFEFEPHDYFHFGQDAFGYTDFENNTEPVPVSEVYTNGDNSGTYQSVTFTLTDPIQDVIIDGAMTYFLSATSTDPCNVTDPGTFYVGNETWYALYNTATSQPVTIRFMSDFLNFFIDNYNDNCLNQNTPENIDPIYRPKNNFALNAGTYELRVYSRTHFNIHLVVSKNIVRPKVIVQNSSGVYAKTAGGLRIKRIVSAAQGAPEQVRKYVYDRLDVNGQRRSTGRLMLYPNYHVYQDFLTQYSVHFDGVPTVSVCSYRVKRVKGSSWTSLPLGTSASGSIVGYDNVTELLGENGENGTTEYYYSNRVEEPSFNPLQIEGLPTITRSSNGLMDSVLYFDTSHRLLKSTHYQYKRQMAKAVLGIASQPVKEPMAREVLPCWMNTALQTYFLVSDRWVASKKSEKQYWQNQLLSIETQCEYDTLSHLQLKSEKTTASDGVITKTEYAYPPEASWIPAAMWQDKFMYDKVVEKKIFKNTSLTSTYKALYNAQAGTFLLGEEQAAKGSAPLEPLNTYMYTTNGNAAEITGRNGIAQTYLWGYNHSYPIAQITNATFAQVRAAMGNISETALSQLAGESTPSAGYLSLVNGLRGNLPEAKVSTYTYTPMVGLSTVTDPNGVTAYYEYDTLGRLIALRDTQGNIVKTYFYQYRE